MTTRYQANGDEPRDIQDPLGFDFSLYGTQHANIPLSPPRTPTKSATQMRREAAEQRAVFRASRDQGKRQHSRDRLRQSPQHHCQRSVQDTSATELDAGRLAVVDASPTRPNEVDVGEAAVGAPSQSPDGAPSPSMESMSPSNIVSAPTSASAPALPSNDYARQRSSSAPRQRSPSSFLSQAVALGIRPPWDDSSPPPPPYLRTLAAEEIARKPLPCGMHAASLLHYVEKVCERVRCTGRRVERAVSILESASGHAMNRYTDSDAEASERLSTSFASTSTRYNPSNEEWKLLLAFERLGCVAHECTKTMDIHRERLLSLTHQLASSLQTLEAHQHHLDEMSIRPTSVASKQPRTAATDFELFRMQADANYASELEQHVRTACIQAVQAARSQSSNVETAAARRQSSLHGLAASPQRLRPAARLLSVKAGVDGVISSHLKHDTTTQSTSALLRGRYPLGRSASPPRGRRLKAKESKGGKQKQPPTAEASACDASPVPAPVQQDQNASSVASSDAAQAAQEEY